MICPLIAAVELNDKFRAALERLLVDTGSDASNRMLRDIVVTKITDFSYRLGCITSMDLKNFEIFTGIQEVMYKTSVMIDEGRI